MPSEKELEKRMEEIKKLHGVFLQKMKKFENDRDLKKENTFILSQIVELSAHVEQIRKAGWAFYFCKTDFFTAR